MDEKSIRETLTIDRRTGRMVKNGMFMFGDLMTALGFENGDLWWKAEEQSR